MLATKDLTTNADCSIITSLQTDNHDSNDASSPIM